MSAQLKRDLEAQQRTIRNLYVRLEQYRRAVGNAIPMILAGYNDQALKDLQGVKESDA